MKQNDFEKVFSETINYSSDILNSKSKEYAIEGEDRLHNFNAASRMTGRIPEAVLFGFALKHIIALSDMINKAEEEGDSNFFPPGCWDEKIMDILNYMILLRAVRTEQMCRNTPKEIQPRGVI